jgi:hypothetical protein
MDNTRFRRTAAAAGVAGLTLIAFAPGASAHDRGNPLTASIAELNSSGVTGVASVEVTGNKVDVHYQAQGLLPNAPHAAHIHFGEQAANECPPQSADGGDGQLSTLDGVPFYGPIAISLTTVGDTSPASGLAIDRFSDAPDGTITYHREDIKTDRAVTKAIEAGRGVLVLHGVDYNHNGTYDFEAGTSDLDPALPAEATDPAACGVIE